MFPRLCRGVRKCVRIVFAVLVFSVLASSVLASRASAQTDNWVGTTGNWSDAAQWDNGVPVTGDNIVIGTVTASSLDDFSLSISGLTLGNSADALTIPKGVVLNDSGPISNAGTLDILPGAVVNVGSLPQIVENIITGGQWLLSSDLNITGPAQQIQINDATVTLSGGTFRNQAGSDAFATVGQNGGTLRLMNSTTFTLYQAFTNDGQIVIGKGSKLVIAAGYDYEQFSGKTLNDGWMVNGIFIRSGVYMGAGSVAGSLGIGGTYLVGDEGKSALVQVTGIYSQGSNGILSIGIGGTTVGTQYSQLKTGPAQLAGKLVAPLLNGFTPTMGQKFTVILANPVVGTFSNKTVPINSSEHFAITYTPTKVILTVVSGPAAE